MVYRHSDRWRHSRNVLSIFISGHVLTEGRGRAHKANFFYEVWVVGVPVGDFVCQTFHMLPFLAGVGAAVGHLTPPIIE